MIIMDENDMWSEVWSLVTDDAEGDHVITITVTHASKSAIITHLLPCCTNDARRRKVLAELLKVGKWDVLGSVFDTDIFHQYHMLIFDFLPTDRLNEDSVRLWQHFLNNTILCRCSLDELGSTFPRLVEREFWESVYVLLQHVVSKTIDTWASSPTVRFSRSVLWRIAHSHMNVDPTVFNQVTKIPSRLEDLPRPKLLRHMDQSLCMGLCTSLLTIVVKTCLTTSPDAVEDSVSSSSNDRESFTNITVSEVDDLEMKIRFFERTFFDDKMFKLFHDSQSDTDGKLIDTFSDLHAYCVLQMEKPSLPNLSSRISQLLFVKRFIGMWFSMKDLTDQERRFMFVVCSMPFLRDVQSTCLQFLLHVKNLDLVLLFDKSNTEEGIRHQVFKLAMEEKRWDVVKKWADQTLPDDQRQQALAEARRQKKKDVVRVLKGKVAPNDNSNEANFDMEIVRLDDWRTIDKNWRPCNDPDEMDGWTSLHLACYDNRFDDVDKFVDCQITENVDPASIDQDTAQAESNEEETTFSETQTGGSNSSSQQANVAEASTSANTQTISNGQTKSENGDTLLKASDSTNETPGNQNIVEKNTEQTYNQAPKILKMIKFEYRASVINSQTEDGETPLLVASKEGNVKVVNKLLKYKDYIDVNLPDNQGRTPLLIAYENGHLDVVGELVLFGADANLPNKEGKTPISLSIERGDTDIWRMLCPTR